MKDGKVGCISMEFTTQEITSFKDGVISFSILQGIGDNNKEICEYSITPDIVADDIEQNHIIDIMSRYVPMYKVDPNAPITTTETVDGVTTTTTFNPVTNVETKMVNDATGSTVVTTDRNTGAYTSYMLAQDGTTTVKQFDPVATTITDIYTCTTYTSTTVYNMTTGVMEEKLVTSTSTTTKTIQSSGSYTESIVTDNTTENITYDGVTHVKIDATISGSTTTKIITNDLTGYKSTVVDNGTKVVTNTNDPTINTVIYSEETNKTNYMVTTVSDPLSGNVCMTTIDTVNNKSTITIRTLDAMTSTITTATTDGNTSTTVVDDPVNHVITESVVTPAKNITTTFYTNPVNGDTKTTMITKTGNKTTTVVTTVSKDINTGIVTTIKDDGSTIVTTIYNPTTGKTTSTTVKKK